MTANASPPSTPRLGTEKLIRLTAAAGGKVNQLMQRDGIARKALRHEHDQERADDGADEDQEHKVNSRVVPSHLEQHLPETPGGSLELSVTTAAPGWSQKAPLQLNARLCHNGRMCGAAVCYKLVAWVPRKRSFLNERCTAICLHRRLRRMHTESPSSP